MNVRSGTSGMECQVTPSATVVTLWGEIDASLRPTASSVMASLVVQDSSIPVIIDARDVTFIDSSGVAFVLQLYALGQETGIEVILRSPSVAVLEVLEMVGIRDRIPVE